jgi:hypothetical protein
MVSQIQVRCRTVSRLLMRMGITQEWGGKTLHYEDLYNLYFSSNLKRITK